MLAFTVGFFKTDCDFLAETFRASTPAEIETAESAINAASAGAAETVLPPPGFLAFLTV